MTGAIAASPIPPVIDLANSPSNSPSLEPASSAASSADTADSETSTPATSISANEDSAQAAELRKEIIAMLQPGKEGHLPKIIPGDAAFAYSRQLPVTLLYDERGLKIYDRLINEASDYYLFNAELQILRDHSNDIVRRMLLNDTSASRKHQDRKSPPPPPPLENEKNAGAAAAQEKDVWGSSKVGVHNDGVNGQHSIRSGAFANLGAATPSNNPTTPATQQTAPPAVIELGAGSLRKTVHLLRAFGNVWGSEVEHPGGSAAHASAPAGGADGTHPTSSTTVEPLKYYALDLSRAELDRTLGELVQQEHGAGRVAPDGKAESVLYNGALSVNGIWGDYNQGLKYIGNKGLTPTSIPNVPESAEGKRIFLWLGSSIGNFSPRAGAAAFLRNALCGASQSDGQPAMRPGDNLLIGLDRRNNPSLVAHAYHDTLGITEEFILNGLEHADRVLRVGTELAGEQNAGSVVDVRKFAYHDRYAEPEGRHESYYRSLERQTIRIPPLLPSKIDSDADAIEGLSNSNTTPAKEAGWTEVTLEKDELIHVEVSIKYSPAERAVLFQAAGLREVQAWTDDSGKYDVILVERPPFLFGSADTMPFETPLDVLSQPAEKADAQKTTQDGGGGSDAVKENVFGLPSWAEWEKSWQAWDTVTLGMIPRKMLFEKPIDLRHICLFYLGHIPGFLDIHLSRYLQEPDTNDWFSRIFERGIDPHMDDPTQCHSHSEVPTKDEDWPTLEQIIDYKERVVARLRGIYDAIAEGNALGKTGKSLTKRAARMLWMLKEHQELHMETLLYMLVQSPNTMPPPGFIAPDFDALATQWDAVDLHFGGAKARQALIRFEEAQDVVLGHDDIDRDDHQVVVDPTEGSRRTGETEDAWIARLNALLGNPKFGWDNESPARTVATGKYAVRSTPITNEEYLDFFNSLPAQDSKARADALPPSWILLDAGENQTLPSGELKAEHVGVRSVYGPVPFAQSRLWPVQASGAQLAAYARSVGGRLPTQAELLRFWDHERAYVRAHRKFSSWNDAALLAGKNVGFKNWHPIPAVPLSDEALSADRVPHNGGVFEWTSSKFDNYDGFQPSELYPAYSVDFFDGKHQVVLGGSWATTPTIAGRRSFTNEYQEPYGMIFGGARVAFDL